MTWCQATAYTSSVIESFRSKDLRRLWDQNDPSGIRPDWRKRVTLILSALDAAHVPEEMDLPGLRFHRLIGDQAGRFAVVVSRNWRVTFGWRGQDATLVDLEDYHG